MKISTRIRNFWREVEDIMTAATGPILIGASAIAAADIFSNHVFSLRFAWIPAAWAVARALAVTIWLGAAFEFYLRARERGSGGWWLMLALALFAVDLQTALLFAIQDEHMAAVGQIPLVTIPDLYWAFEQAVLGVILIAVHRAVDHQTHTALSLAETSHAVTQPTPIRHNVQPADEAAGMLRRGVPTARRAFYTGSIAPLTIDEDGEMLEYVSDEQEPPTRGERGLSRQTRTPGRKPRRDAGSESSAKETRIQRLMTQLRVTPKMTIDDVVEFLNVSRGTAVTDRREAKQRLAQEKDA